MPNTYDKVLITGGAGMLAQAFVRCLQVRGVDSMALPRASLNVGKFDSVADAWATHQPTLVINCAAYTKVDLAESESGTAGFVNARAPGLLRSFAGTNRARLVHFSTDFVFDGRSSNPYKPNDPTNALSEYGKSKLRGEQAVLYSSADDTADVLIIRTSWLYGPNGPNFVQTMLNAARSGKPLTVVDDQIGSPTFTHDLAETTLDLIDRGATGIYHATNSGQTTWFAFAKAIFEEFGIANVDLKPISSAKWTEQKPNSAIRPAYSVLDCSETEKLIGRPMPDWRDALHRYRMEIEKPEIRNQKSE